jgi:hypothetical protein
MTTSTKPKVIIAGGSGFLGQHLESALTARNYQVIILTRLPKRPNHVRWDGETLGNWTTQIDEAQVVVNLTGRSVNTRYTPKNRREIINSRVKSVAVINQAILNSQTPPSILVQVSSLAIYGDTGGIICDETTPASSGFSPEVCIQWEDAFYASDLPNTRRVVLRTGLALANDGGALEVLAKLTRFFLGGKVGSGRQYISWLHIEDMNRIFLQAIEDETWEGIYNATGPNPVTNAEFMRTLRQTLKRPWSPPAPAFAVHIGSWFMRTEPQLALHGRRCVPKRLLDQGFEFHYPDLQAALTDIFA